MIFAATLRSCALLLLFAVALSGCSNKCGNSVARQMVGPAEKHVAVLFQRNCDVTTGYSSQISLLAEGEAPGEEGNLFIADTNQGAAPAGASGGPRVEMEWQASDRLLISYDRRARVLKRVTHFDGVTIAYRQI